MTDKEFPDLHYLLINIPVTAKFHVLRRRLDWYHCNIWCEYNMISVRGKSDNVYSAIQDAVAKFKAKVKK